MKAQRYEVFVISLNFIYFRIIKAKEFFSLRTLPPATKRVRGRFTLFYAQSKTMGRFNLDTLP